MVQNTLKVVITGAGGQIGYALLFRIASGQMFGPNVSIEFRLLELEHSIPSLRGLQMELEDCAFPLLKNVICTSDAKTAMTDANWIILVGAAPRKAGMERADLLQINGGIFSKQGQAINKYSASDVRILVVGNPCNTNAMIAMNNAPDVPTDRFYALTMLDELRAKAQIILKSGCNVEDITQLAIWGNHSSTQYPDIYNAKIHGQPAISVIEDESWSREKFIETVQNRGAEVIKARGASSAASAANAIILTINHLINDTKQDDFFSLCKCSEGEYDVDEGLIFSFPCQVVNGQVTTVLGLSHNEFGKRKLLITLEELRKEREIVKQLGLLN